MHIMKTFIKLNIANFIIIVLSSIVGYSLVTGSILNYINFEDPISEMVLFVFCMVAIMMSFATLETSDNN
jgi:hypothetical protein